jgi:hypothetical protein
MKGATLFSKIRQSKGWFPAGNEFRKASQVLSDGAFKLFFHLAIEADSRTGCVQATYRALAAELKKSKRAIGTYAAELSEKETCTIRPGENQYCKTTFRISDDYWPYERDTASEAPEKNSYVAAIQKAYLSLGCTKARFSAGDEQKAREFEQRGVPLEVVEDAMLMGACRKYSSWLEGRASEPIGSLAYFENLIAEIKQQPFPEGYREYVSAKNLKFAEAWAEKTRSVPRSGRE